MRVEKCENGCGEISFSGKAAGLMHVQGKGSGAGICWVPKTVAVCQFECAGVCVFVFVCVPGFRRRTGYCRCSERPLRRSPQEQPRRDSSALKPVTHTRTQRETVIRSSTTVPSKSLFLESSLADLLLLSLYNNVPFIKCGTTKIFLIPFINKGWAVRWRQQDLEQQSSNGNFPQIPRSCQFKICRCVIISGEAKSKALIRWKHMQTQIWGGAQANQHAADISTGYWRVRLSCYCFLFQVPHARIISPFLFFWLQGQGIKTSLPWER